MDAFITKETLFFFKNYLKKQKLKTTAAVATAAATATAAGGVWYDKLKCLLLVDKFTYLGNSVASTEKDIDTRLTKAMDSYRWAIDYMEIRPNR